MHREQLELFNIQPKTIEQDADEPYSDAALFAIHSERVISLIALCMANNIPIPALDNDLHLLTLQRQRNRTARLEAALLSNLIDTMDVWEKPEELLKWRRRSAPLREDPVPALQARAPSVQLPVAPRAPLQQEAALFHPRAHDDVPMRREAAPTLAAQAPSLQVAPARRQGSWRNIAQSFTGTSGSNVVEPLPVRPRQPSQPAQNQAQANAASSEDESIASSSSSSFSSSSSSSDAPTSSTGDDSALPIPGAVQRPDDASDTSSIGNDSVLPNTRAAQRPALPNASTAQRQNDDDDDSYSHIDSVYSYSNYSSGDDSNSARENIQLWSNMD